MKIKNMIFIVCLIIFAVGCSKEQIVQYTPKDLEQIKLILVDKEETDEGINYTISLTNNSDYT